MKFTKISFLSSGDIKAQKRKATAFFSQNGEFLSGDIDDSDYSIASIISRYATYPNEALELGISGKVVVQFTLTSHGQIKDIKIKNSSGHKILDDAAIKTIKEISPNFQNLAKRLK
ncbi:energy transducer TonB [Campylobacter sp.]|uniref:energy transducer TonB n=1 Tax=Campylobacter sp. TaxID=205 RepID=UPI002709A066|nr:energy transducer TonB [Campylobacter sp.]